MKAPPGHQKTSRLGPANFTPHRGRPVVTVAVARPAPQADWLQIYISKVGLSVSNLAVFFVYTVVSFTAALESSKTMSEDWTGIAVNKRYGSSQKLADISPFLLDRIPHDLPFEHQQHYDKYLIHWDFVTEPGH